MNNATQKEAQDLCRVQVQKAVARRVLGPKARVMLNLAHGSENSPHRRSIRFRSATVRKRYADDRYSQGPWGIGGNNSKLAPQKGDKAAGIKCLTIKNMRGVQTGICSIKQSPKDMLDLYARQRVGAPLAQIPNNKTNLRQIHRDSKRSLRAVLGTSDGGRKYMRGSLSQQSVSSGDIVPWVQHGSGKN